MTVDVKAYTRYRNGEREYVCAHDRGDAGTKTAKVRVGVASLAQREFARLCREGYSAAEARQLAGLPQLR